MNAVFRLFLFVLSFSVITNFSIAAEPEDNKDAVLVSVFGKVIKLPDGFYLNSEKSIDLSAIVYEKYPVQPDIFKNFKITISAINENSIQIKKEKEYIEGIANSNPQVKLKSGAMCVFKYIELLNDGTPIYFELYNRQNSIKLENVSDGVAEQKAVILKQLCKSAT